MTIPNRVNIFAFFVLLMGFTTGSEIACPVKQAQGPRITNFSRWECAGVILRGAKSYGQYTFRISTDAERLDENIVAGLFLYGDDENEVDIEFSRCSNAEAVSNSNDFFKLKSF